jgi:hypothetical protein
VLAQDWAGVKFINLMAGINGFQFPFDRARCGCVFLLNRPARDSMVISPEPGTEVEIQAGNQLIVANSDATQTHPALLFHLQSVAQKALDISAFKGDALAIADTDTLVIWWNENGQKIIRFIGIDDITSDARGTITLRDADGSIVLPAPDPPLVWHESFRYFRISQTTVDLFDAYRNLYLALEAILSSITPTLKPTGKRKLEGEWLDEALAAAEGQGFVHLAHYAADPGNALASLREELYELQRTHVFHAKVDRGVHLPQDPIKRITLSKSLERLGRLYVDLASAYLGVRRGSGGIGIGGVDLHAAELAKLSMCVTDDRRAIDPSLTKVPDVTLVALNVREAPELSQPFLRFFIGTIGVTDLGSLSYISRIFWFWTEGRKLAIFHTIPANLHLEGADRFEAQLGVRFGHARRLRTRYSH